MNVILMFLYKLKSIFVKIIDNVGICGSIIIITLIFSWFQYSNLKDKDLEIFILKSDIKDLNDSIDIQNSKIIIANNARELIQNNLDIAAKKNVVLDKNNKKLQFELNLKPITLTCEDAILEIRNESTKNAIRWNSR